MNEVLDLTIVLRNTERAAEAALAAGETVVISSTGNARDDHRPRKVPR